MSKTIVVSNRLPVKISEKDGELSFSSSEGGLATGLGSVYKEGDNIWIGWPGLEVAEEKKDLVRTELAGESLIPVFLSQEEINEYYEGFSNEILWPIFHYYASTYAHYNESNWAFYKQVNEKFRDTVLSAAEPGDTIWIHDYQLLLLPGLIRAALPDITIGFFQHIPFPSFELFRLIPWRAELLEGMLGADLVGFHTFEDARHFINATTRLLTHTSSSNLLTVGERSVMVESFPMGIDSTKYAALTHEPQVMEELASLQNNFKDIHIILSVDRLDYSKGILQRLSAFELLLENHPEYIDKIALYMIVVPSRDTVPQYRELHDNIDKRVGNINGRFRTMNWSPIHYFYRSFPIETLSALYQAADICLVTPMRDGMNLVSKEYVASRTRGDGVLILSEMAGASKELVDAIIINPSNTTELCHAIHTALHMPEHEQKRSMGAMREIVFKFTVAHWVKIFMSRLQEVKFLQEGRKAKKLYGLAEESVADRYKRAGSRILFLDYDGTMVDFHADIDKASPDRNLYDLLDKLSSDGRNTVVLISGRKHETLEKWFKTSGLILVAEHGSWTMIDQGSWHKLSGLNDAWKSDIFPILESYADRTAGSSIEEKSYSLAWHYRKVETDLGEIRANELINNLKYIASDKGLQILPGNKVVEIKNIEINKGKAALGFLEMDNYDFVMAIGDDHTDEDMFKVLPPSAITIKVGSNISEARYFLNSFREVRTFLSKLGTEQKPVQA